MEAVSILASALVGGFAGAERKSFLSAMLSQPLVVASALGIVWGEFYSALFLGALCQLYFIGAHSIGASLSADETLASTVIVASALWASDQADESFRSAIEGMAIAFGIPFAHLGKRLERRNMDMNVSALVRAADKLKAGLDDEIFSLNFMGFISNLVQWFIISLLLITLLGALIGGFYNKMPVTLLDGFAFFREGFLYVALIAAMRALRVRKLVPALAVGLMLGILFVTFGGNIAL